MRLEASSTVWRAGTSAGSTSNVPRGAWSFSGKLAQERVGRALATERGEPHVARKDLLLVGGAVEQRLDRARQHAPVAARQIGPADRALEQDVAAEERVLDGVGDVARAVAGGEDDVDVEARERQPLAAL